MSRWASGMRRLYEWRFVFKSCSSGGTSFCGVLRLVFPCFCPHQLSEAAQRMDAKALIACSNTRAVHMTLDNMAEHLQHLTHHSLSQVPVAVLMRYVTPAGHRPATHSSDLTRGRRPPSKLSLSTCLHPAGSSSARPAPSSEQSAESRGGLGWKFRNSSVDS